eukprot:Lankesteria_metandrocarpae@DN3511_c1_g1_i1.p1
MAAGGGGGGGVDDLLLCLPESSHIPLSSLQNCMYKLKRLATQSNTHQQQTNPNANTIRAQECLEDVLDLAGIRGEDSLIQLEKCADDLSKDDTRRIAVFIARCLFDDDFGMFYTGVMSTGQSKEPGYVELRGATLQLCTVLVSHTTTEYFFKYLTKHFTARCTEGLTRAVASVFKLDPSSKIRIGVLQLFSAVLKCITRAKCSDKAYDRSSKYAWHGGQQSPQRIVDPRTQQEHHSPPVIASPSRRHSMTASELFAAVNGKWIVEDVLLREFKIKANSMPASVKAEVLLVIGRMSLYFSEEFRMRPEWIFDLLNVFITVSAQTVADEATTATHY